jgi:aspartyl-tRNA(Asn)/glutamyl-tRNA(Gln) amidotransferase subunit A
VPVDPPYIGRVAGPIARTVADCALLMQVISRPDARDHMCLPPASIDWPQLDCEVKGLKLGLLLDIGVGMPPEPEVKAAIEAAAAAFVDAGALVEPIPPFLTRAMLDGLDQFWRVRAWSDMASLPPERLAKVLPYIRQWAEAGADLSGLEVFRGFSRIMEIRAATLAACRPYDFILSPTAPLPAFAAELASPADDPARPFEHVCFTVAFNMSEQPAISVNCGYTREGLPIGLQIAGRRFDDLGVLQLARACEQMRPPQLPWPGLDALQDRGWKSAART